MATADFSKFVGILSAALSQHHLLGFGIAQLDRNMFFLILGGKQLEVKVFARAVTSEGSEKENIPCLYPISGLLLAILDL